MNLLEQKRVVHEGDLGVDREFAISDLADPEALEAMKQVSKFGYGIVLRPNTAVERWQQFRQHPSHETFITFAKRVQASVQEALTSPKLASKIATISTIFIS